MLSQHGGAQMVRGGEVRVDHPTSAPVRPAEPSGQPGWLLASLSGLAAALALSGGLAVLGARRAGRRARVGHAA